MENFNLKITPKYAYYYTKIQNEKKKCMRNQDVCFHIY